MKVKAIAGAVALILVLTGQASGCQSEGASRLAPGKHTVTKQLRGYWKANNAVQGCRWVVATKSGDVINSGKWTLSNRTQAVILGTGNIGMTFWPNDACGVWTK